MTVIRVALAFALLALAGCRSEVPPPSATRAERDVTNAWDRLLAEAVDADGQVDYSLVAKKRPILDAYLGSMALVATPVNARRGLAFWLNAYQALAIASVVELEPSVSLLDYGYPIPWRGFAFFHGRAHQISNHHWTLAEILHERLLLQFQDYRILAAVNPGFRGGPPLRAGVYRGTSVDRQLDEQFQRWIRDPRTVQWADDHAVFHSYFEIYEQEFRRWSGTTSPCALAARHARGELRERLSALQRHGCPHQYQPLDDALNRADGGAGRTE